MIEVRWNESSERGFIDRDSAQRFIDQIAKVVAPDLDYKVNGI